MEALITKLLVDSESRTNKDIKNIARMEASFQPWQTLES
jgi:hypothetical protein